MFLFCLATNFNIAQNGQKSKRFVQFLKCKIYNIYSIYSLLQKVVQFRYFLQQLFGIDDKKTADWRFKAVSSIVAIWARLSWIEFG